MFQSSKWAQRSSLNSTTSTRYRAMRSSVINHHLFVLNSKHTNFKTQLNDIQQNISSPPSRYILILAGGLVGFFLSILYRNRIQNVRVAYSVLEITPLLIIIPLLFLDHRQWIETLRAPWLPWLWLSTLIPIVIYIFTVFSRYTF